MVPGCCGPLSRRELLRRAVLLAGAPAVDGWPDRAAAAAGGAGPVPADLELLTVTDTALALRWTTGDPARPDLLGRPTPLPADTHLLVRDLRGRPVAEVRRDDATAVHLAEVDGLTPGTTYAVEARSADRVATPRLLARIDPAALPAVLPVDPAGLRRVVDGRHQTSAAPGLVTTLVPPDGPLLAVLALTNDLHIGETASGVLQGDLPPAVRQPAGLPAYPELMARAVVAEARARGADVLLVAGDLTAEAALPDAHAARELLLGFGSQVHAGPMVVGSWLAVRGNHDRVHGGDDTVGAVFGLSHQRLAVADVGGLRVIALDTSTQQPGGAIGAGQLAALREELRRDSDRPTLVLGHHPVTDASAAATLGGRAFDLDADSARAIETAYAAAPGVFLHHAGHTHRAHRSSSLTAAHVEFLEVGAAKEYPGCVTLVRVHTGGYQVSTHPLRDPQALAWAARSGTQFAGYYPAYVLGSVEDRNHVVRRDLSGLVGIRPGPAPTAARDHHTALLATGAGAVAVGGAAAAALQRRRHGTRRSPG